MSALGSAAELPDAAAVKLPMGATPADLAAEILGLLGGPRRRKGLGEAARAYAATRSFEAVAEELYRHFGFRPAGVRRNYYVETNEDALVMWADDVDSKEYRHRLDGLAAGVPGTTVVEEVRPW